MGRRTSAADSGSAFTQAAFSAYDYNDRNELIASDRYLGTSINDTGNPVSAEQRGYQYDPIGNRTQATTAGAEADYAANQLNQYTNIAGAMPTYDPDGNMTATPDGMAYSYNAENRLIAAQPQTPTEGSTRVEFVYDYMGRRVQKVVYTYSAGSWVQDKEIRFVYDGWNMIKETTITGQASVDRYYVWGLDLSQSMQGAGGVGGLLAIIDGSFTYHYLYDANGNVGQLVDAADGSIAARYEYDPYGNLTDLGGAYADANAYRFSTKYFDQETSLYYYGYRYYSAELGRWINRDPIAERGGYNLLSFIQNDPSNNIDNLGLIIPADSSGNINYGFYNPYTEPSNWPYIHGYVPTSGEPKFPSFDLISMFVKNVAPQGAMIDSGFSMRITPLGTGWVFAGAKFRGSLFACYCGKSDEGDIQLWFKGGVIGQVWWQAGFSITVYEAGQNKTIELLKSGGNSKRLFSKTKFSHLLGGMKKCPGKEYSVTLSVFASIEASAGVGWEGKIKGGYEWTTGSRGNGWVGSKTGKVTYGGWGTTAKLGGEVDGNLKVPLGNLQ